MASSFTPKNSSSNAMGYINSRHTVARVQKMKWSLDNDIKVARFGFEREVSTDELWPIAHTFPGKCLLRRAVGGYANDVR